MGYPIKPSDIARSLCGSALQNYEKECVARCIIMMSHLANDDTWKPFTWDDYINFCDHDPIPLEREILEGFVVDGYLGKEGETYQFTQKIVAIFVPFMK